MLAVLNALGLRSTCSVVCREIYDQVRAEIEAKWPEAASNHTGPDTTDLIITERARNRPADDAEGLPDMTETPESATPTQAPLEPGSRHVFKNKSERKQLHGEIRPLGDFRGGGAEIVMN